MRGMEGWRKEWERDGGREEVRKEEEGWREEVRKEKEGWREEVRKRGRGSQGGV